jgi:hypothetical protein
MDNTYKIWELGANAVSHNDGKLPAKENFGLWATCVIRHLQLTIARMVACII